MNPRLLDAFNRMAGVKDGEWASTAKWPIDFFRAGAMWAFDEAARVMREKSDEARVGGASIATCFYDSMERLVLKERASCE